MSLELNRLPFSCQNYAKMAIDKLSSRNDIWRMAIVSGQGDRARSVAFASPRGTNLGKYHVMTTKKRYVFHTHTLSVVTNG